MSVSPELQKHAIEWFRKAAGYAERDDWEAAASAYHTCVKMVPDNTGYRQHLRGATRKKYNDNGKGAGMGGKIKLKGLKAKVKLAKTKKSWAEVDKLCEEGMQINPWDGGLNADLAQSAWERGFLDVAVYAATCAVEADPNDTGHLKLLGEILEEKRDFAQAAQVFERVMKLEPNNEEARRKVGAMHTQSTLTSGGYETAGSTREVSQEEEAPQERVSAYEAYGKQTEEKRELTEEERLQREVRKEEGLVEPRLKLAHYYETNKEWLKAVKTLQDAMQVSGDNPDIKERWQEANLSRLREDIDKVRQRAEKNPDAPGPKQQLKSLAEQLAKAEVEYFTFKEERHPQDMKAKYELAKRFMQTGNFGDAITRFQQATSDSRLKGSCFLLLGKCYGQDKKGGMALSAFENAIPELDPKDQPDEFCDANYWAARLYEQKGDKVKAEQYYTAVLGVNYTYKDANDRLVQLQGGEDLGMDFMG